MKKLNLSKLKKTIFKNKQLFIGLAIGALIMLPTGLYINERNNNRQTDQPNTTLDTKTESVSTNAQGLSTVTGQPSPTQNNSQSSVGGTYNPSTSPTSTYKASVCTETVVPYETRVERAPTFLEIGSYKIVDGANGYKKDCTSDSLGSRPMPVTIASVPKYIYVGTSELDLITPATIQPNPGVRERILTTCAPVMSGTGNQAAYNICVSAMEHYLQNWLTI